MSVAMNASVKLLCLLAICVGLSVSQAKVSKSFVRGFLVGYAKGLEEGKSLSSVHHVACAFHPVGEHEPHGPPDHGYHGPPEHEPHGPDGYASNSHSTRTASSSISVSGQESRTSGSPLDEKKAASTLAIQKAVMDKFKA